MKTRIMLAVILIGALGQRALPTAIAATSSDGCLITGTPAGKPVADAGLPGYMTLSVKVMVTNSCAAEADARVQVQGIDKDGYEVVARMVDGPVPGHALVTLTSSFPVTKAMADAIVSWRVVSVSD